MKSRNQLVKLINNAYSSLYNLRHQGNIDLIEKVYQMNLKEEKQHRNCMSGFYEHHNKPLSPSICAKMFTVKHLAEAMNSNIKYEVKDLLYIKKSVLYSQAIIENYKEIAKDCFKDYNIEELSNLDYCELVN